MIRSALVTGAGSGIGRAIALRLAADGANVFCAGRTVAALEETVEAITAGGGLASVLRLDLRDAAAVAELPKRCGHIDALVANSGIAGPRAPVWEIDPDEWEATLRVNLTGGFLLARAILPDMLERGSGSVVFVGSTTATRPMPGRAAYAASKSGLVGLVRSTALDAGPFGVRVNLVTPGPVAGDRLDAVLNGQAVARGSTPERVRSEFLAQSPLRRLTESEDIANAVAYLAGEASKGITGAELVVSSGVVMG
ncbi:SDR family NAD(P)-dependent oxidoreductase [Conexibacter sp. DBS9H8]|uniref:SDR family NAD(P)-dependent oxidoreductase n=1 Tax=Conexibacter sp. DBS9H8 TaxID=2937801 RepID=UPI00200ECDE7|nr:SDR family NAD(P)-dependent oxidoreductase [Conexibacter sp. DBS9H8]